MVDSLAVGEDDRRLRDTAFLVGSSALVDSALASASIPVLDLDRDWVASTLEVSIDLAASVVAHTMVVDAADAGVDVPGPIDRDTRC